VGVAKSFLANQYKFTRLIQMKKNINTFFKSVGVVIL